MRGDQLRKSISSMYFESPHLITTSLQRKKNRIAANEQAMTERSNPLSNVSSENLSDEEKTIRIVEHPGFLEVLDQIFDIEPGNYTFEVTTVPTLRTNIFVTDCGTDKNNILTVFPI
jgi:hypothetical protein